MPRKKSFRKTANRPVRFTDDQLARIEQAAQRRAEATEERVTATHIIREGALRLADEINAAA